MPTGKYLNAEVHGQKILTKKNSIVYLSKKGLNLGSTTSVRLRRIYSTST